MRPLVRFLRQCFVVIGARGFELEDEVELVVRAESNLARLSGSSRSS
jgi:hypothetical protein